MGGDSRASVPSEGWSLSRCVAVAAPHHIQAVYTARGNSRVCLPCPPQLLVRSKWSAALRLQHYGVGDKFAVAIGRGYVTAIQCWWLVWLTECGARVMSQAEIAAKLGVRGTLPGAVRAAAVLRGF